MNSDEFIEASIDVTSYVNIETESSRFVNKSECTSHVLTLIDFLHSLTIIN